jgi:hypothetical protein
MDPLDPERKKYIGDDGTTFQATREEVKSQRHKLMDVTPSVEALPKKTTPTTTRRGRKPKVTTMMPEPTAERTMNQDSLFESE